MLLVGEREREGGGFGFSNFLCHFFLICSFICFFHLFVLIAFGCKVLMEEQLI